MFFFYIFCSLKAVVLMYVLEQITFLTIFIQIDIKIITKRLLQHWLEKFSLYQTY